MKIAKKIEAEIKYTMNDYWESYLSGNLDHWASYLVNDYKNIGTTEAEIWKSKKEIYDYSISVLDQMVGYTELRNKKTEIIPYDPYIMVHEYLDIYIKIEEKWIFYSKLRLSSLIQKIENNWKILHQHGSYPDSKVMDGEFFAFDTLKSENLKLQKAVKDRTEELEKTNRELEIETSLERVRAIALSMKEPADMLEVCKVISNQLQLLGIKDIRNIQTAIFNRSNKTYINYEYYKLHDKELITEIDYTIHPKQNEWANEMLKSSDTFFSTSFSGNDLKEWVENQRKSSQFVDSYLQEAESLNYYYYSIGPVAIGMSTYTSLNNEDLIIFKKFKNVFELSYKRFIDIKKAEAQAKEAQIEAALERVRARAMGMHSSEELAEVAKLLFEQIKHLGVESFSSGFNIWDDEHKNLTSWMSNDTGDIQHPFKLPIQEFEQHRRIFSSWQMKESFLEDDIKGKDLVKHYKFLRSFPLLDESFNLAEAAGIKIPERQVHNIAFFSYGYLLFITLEPCPQFHLIFKRFAKVFNQTYTRFLDLKKAEAQAREAEIEVALERVRSRSMAMHTSDEFVDASDVMVNQLKVLGINTLRVGIAINNKEDGSVEIWSKSEIEGKVKNTILGIVPRGVHPIFDNMVDAWKEKKSFYSSERVGDEVKEYYEKLDPCLSYPRRTEFNERETMTAFFFKHGSLNVISLKPLKEEDRNIMIRFAKVFGQIYQRFLDLQIAEAQAREAQIEASLERVRSRSMAMQKSEELKEVIRVIYDQFIQLNINIEHTGFIVDYKTRDDMHIWLADKNGPLSEIIFPYFDSPHWNSFIDAKEKGLNFFANHLNFEEKNKFYKKLFTFIPDLPEEAKKFYFNCPGLAISTVLLENVGLYIENFSGTIYSDEENKILMRFGKVFQQTYTRFLDLQKAEEQARESEIELALERVRASTMAMQHSEELPEAALLLFSQIQSLGIPAWSAGYNIFEVDKKSCLCVMSSEGLLQTAFHLPLTEEASFWEWYEAIQRRDSFFVQELGGKQLTDHYGYLMQLPGVQEAIDPIQEAGISLPTYQIDHLLTFRMVFYFLSHYEPCAGRT